MYWLLVGGKNPTSRNIPLIFPSPLDLKSSATRNCFLLSRSRIASNVHILRLDYDQPSINIEAKSPRFSPSCTHVTTNSSLGGASRVQQDLKMTENPPFIGTSISRRKGWIDAMWGTMPSIDMSISSSISSKIRIATRYQPGSSTSAWQLHISLVVVKFIELFSKVGITIAIQRKPVPNQTNSRMD